MREMTLREKQVTEVHIREQKEIMSTQKVCYFCDCSSNLTSFFLDFNSGNNYKNNVVTCCHHCLQQVKIYRSNEAIKTLLGLGYVCDTNLHWVKREVP